MNDLDFLIEQNEENAGMILATVGSVTANGVTLILDSNAGEATSKEYKCNKLVRFKAGDRVKVSKNSGTYVVEYVIGKPASAISKLSTSATLATVISKVNEIIDRLNGA